jgi:two-component system chemotaxis response regulator CheB
MGEPRDIIVIGGSAGGLEALSRIVSRLPAELDAAIFIVIHTYPVGDSLLPAILSREGRLLAVVPSDGDPIECDRIYVAPPDCHMLIEPGRIRLSSGPKESGHRPAIDPLFRSAARAYGERVIGVVLSGTLDDGSNGLRVIRRHGGSAMAQDPKEALFPQMPRNAIARAEPQHVAPAAEIARLIATHSGKSVQGGELRNGMSEAMSTGVNPNGGERPIGANDVEGTPTGIACPECHGVIWASEDDESQEFHCRVGHAYSSDALLQAHSDSVEAALWAGVRALQEQASLTKHLAGKADRRGDRLTAGRLRERGNTADEHAARIEEILLRRTPKPA